MNENIWEPRLLQIWVVTFAHLNNELNNERIIISEWTTSDFISVSSCPQGLINISLTDLQLTKVEGYERKKERVMPEGGNREFRCRHSHAREDFHRLCLYAKASGFHANDRFQQVHIHPSLVEIPLTEHSHVRSHEILQKGTNHETT